MNREKEEEDKKLGISIQKRTFSGDRWNYMSFMHPNMVKAEKALDEKARCAQYV